MRSAGDWRTDGIRVGMVVRCTVGLTALSLNVNMFVVAVNALTLTFTVPNGKVLATQSGIAGCTVSMPGMKSGIPMTGHTDDSFAFEHWHSDIAQSELFVGCKIAQLDIGLPPTGMTSCKANFLGKDVITGVAQYFSTAPAAATTSGVLASVNGSAMINGLPVALLTGLTFSLKANMSVDAVVGSNTVPAVIPGTVDVDGQMTVLFQDAVMRDYFLNETEVSLSMCMTTGSADNADFMSFTFPRIKVGANGKSDGEKSVAMTMPFTALLPINGGVGFDHDQTSFMICDSLAV